MSCLLIVFCLCVSLLASALLWFVMSSCFALCLLVLYCLDFDALLNSVDLSLVGVCRLLWVCRSCIVVSVFWCVLVIVVFGLVVLLCA